MSAPPKKREIALEERSSDESDNSSENEEGEEYTGQEEIQVEFEGRNPIDSDFHGIKQLLQQLFLKAHLNLSELTELIIGQSFVGSVVKQSDNEVDDDDEDDPNDVFGITTVVNLTEKQNIECISQLRTLLVELSTEHGTDRCSTMIRTLLSDSSKPLGLVINERFVNIPAQISVPLLDSLCKEIKKACEKKMAYDFTYYIFICKLYKVDGKTKGKKKNRKGQNPIEEQDVIWSNPEEELLDEVADMKFEFSVKNETDSGLSGNWLEDDISMTPFRRVILLDAKKLEPLISRIQEFVSR
ncbi:protein BCCIP homolog [Halyomorpha halys]|uniref:protein BCCIP homolog n=1 Tax=Halyomorpha halys TaxID=286706 RepID=UPI0006D514DA|nr:protein BCCIP homolog [Halyomorpha halys]